MKQTTKDQHFLARGYLRGFNAQYPKSKNFIWVYEKEPGRKPRKKSTKSVAFAEFYYAQEDDNGNLVPDLLETGFKDVEDIALRHIKEIQPIPSEIYIPSGNQAGELAFFIALSLTRVPSFRDPIEQLHEWVAT